MANNVIATRSLWSAVGDNNPSKILALLKQGADINARSDKRATGPGLQISRDSLLGEAIRHQALDSLRVLLEQGARLRNNPSSGSEFTRACETATPWMMGIELIMALRPKLTALSHPSGEYKPIHLALLYTSPTSEDPAVITHPLVDVLLQKPGKWAPLDTGLAVRICLQQGKDPALLDRLEAVGVPVAQHLSRDQPEARAKVWEKTSLNTMSLTRWQTWWAALEARGVTPPSDLDMAFIAAYRDHQGQQAAPERRRHRLRS